MEKKFSVGGIVCDKHVSDLPAFSRKLREYGQNNEVLFIKKSWRKVFFGSVHLINNIRNNLLNKKRFVFRSFSFGGFFDDIHFT